MSSAAAIDGVLEPAGRIGPNAVTRVAEALRALEGEQAVDRVFRAANLENYLADSPAEMIDETEVTRLHRALHGALGHARARTIGWIAGQRTADYLLEKRIPLAAQLVLRAAPSRLASRMLTTAIARNAWTFAGTGKFSARPGRPTLLTIKGCPICRGQRSTTPYCDFYAGTFERLYARLVHPQTRVVEIDCEAMGQAACIFAISWS
jgi:divinyl protochlorophyllide a 8-vinyl-reductase